MAAERKRQSTVLKSAAEHARKKLSVADAQDRPISQASLTPTAAANYQTTAAADTTAVARLGEGGNDQPTRCSGDIPSCLSKW